MKTVEAMKWMAHVPSRGSYYVPAHLERAGPFNPNGNNGFNIEHLRNFNNAGPEHRLRHGDAARPRRVRRPRRVHDPPQQHRRRATSTASAARPTAAPASTARRSAACGTRCSAKAATGGSSRAPTGTTAASSVPTTAARRRTSIPANTSATTRMVRDGRHEHKHKLLKPADDRRRPAQRQQLRRQRPAHRPPRVRGLRRRRAGKAIEATGGDKAAGAQGGRALAFKAARENTDVDDKDCATMGEKLVVQPGEDVVIVASWCATRRARTTRRTRSPIRRWPRSASTSRSTRRCSTTST